VGQLSGKACPCGCSDTRPGAPPTGEVNFGRWSVRLQVAPRNLDQRVEFVTPVEDDVLRADLLDTLERCLAEDVNAWDLGPDGLWTRRTPRGPEPRSVQRELMLDHQARAGEAGAAGSSSVAAT